MLLPSRPTLFVLIVVGLLTAGTPACEDQGGHPVTETDDPDDTATGTDTGTVPDTDADTQTDSTTDPDKDSDGYGALRDCNDRNPDIHPDAVDIAGNCIDENCDGWETPPAVEIPVDTEICDWMADSCIVHSADEGTPATPFEICSPGDSPVESNRAAKVSLNLYSQSMFLSTGQVEIPAELRPLIVGTPVISVTDSFPEALRQMEVSDVAASINGYTFNAAWPTDGNVSFASHPYLSIKVSMEISCDADSTDPVTRIVESTTYLSLCNADSGSVSWMSSGETCHVCTYVCEMAASPIVPDGRNESLALPREIGVEIVPVMQFGNHLSLVAQPRGTEGPITYQWLVSSGRISENSLGGVVWEIPSAAGAHQITLIVQDDRSAAVTSLRYRHEV